MLFVGWFNNKVIAHSAAHIKPWSLDLSVKMLAMRNGGDHDWCICLNFIQWRYSVENFEQLHRVEGLSEINSYGKGKV